MSIFKKLFGGRSGGADPSSSEPAAMEAEVYKDCTIVPRPMKEGNQWRLAGSIMRVVDGETVERSFIRADLFGSAEEARGFIVRKAQQIIDENGPRLFERTGNV